MFYIFKTYTLHIIPFFYCIIHEILSVSNGLRKTAAFRTYHLDCKVEINIKHEIITRFYLSNSYPTINSHIISLLL